MAKHEFVQYRLGYNDNGKVYYSKLTTTCLESAKALLEKEEESDRLIECFLVKDTVTREVVE